MNVNWIWPTRTQYRSKLTEGRNVHPARETPCETTPSAISIWWKSTTKSRHDPGHRCRLEHNNFADVYSPGTFDSTLARTARQINIQPTSGFAVFKLKLPAGRRGCATRLTFRARDCGPYSRVVFERTFFRRPYSSLHFSLDEISYLDGVFLFSSFSNQG